MSGSTSPMKQSQYNLYRVVRFCQYETCGTIIRITDMSHQEKRWLDEMRQKHESNKIVKMEEYKRNNY